MFKGILPSYYKTDGSLVNFRRKPFQSTQKTTDKWTIEGMPIRLTLIYSATLSRFGSGPCIRRPTAVQARSHLNTSCQAWTPSIFFLVREKKGGGGVRPHPPNPPWLRACSLPFFQRHLDAVKRLLSFRSLHASYIMGFPVSTRRSSQHVGFQTKKMSINQ